LDEWVLSLRERMAEGQVRAGKPNIIHAGPHPAASRPTLSRRERALEADSFTPSEGEGSSGY